MPNKILHYENRREPLLSRRKFLFRVLRHVGVGFAVIAASLLIGILGYHFFEQLSWLDSLLNASMILGGMGPVDVLHSVAGKVFASMYAIFSGVIFLVVTGLMFAPLVHRVLHRMHLDESGK